MDTDELTDDELTHGIPASFFCPTCGYAKHLHLPGSCPTDCPSCHGERSGKNGYACRRCHGTGVVGGARPRHLRRVPPVTTPASSWKTTSTAKRITHARSAPT